MMSTLLVWRGYLQKIYSRFSVYIMRTLQFLLGILVFYQINSNLGFMKGASSRLVTFGLAFVCTFLPMIILVLAATALVLLHFYALSLPIMVVSAVIFLIFYIFYFRFTPQKSWLILLGPLAFQLKIPFVIPIAFGLLGTPVFVVPAAMGTIVYYLLHYVQVSATAHKGKDIQGLIDAAVSFIKEVFVNKEMWLMVLIMTTGLLVVYAIRTRSFNHAWKIATVLGAIWIIVVGGIGNVNWNLHISSGRMFGNALVAAAVGFVLEFFFFMLDYSRTEYLQFEDNDYCYYVKAIPKIEMAAAEVQVKHINERQDTGKRHDTQSESGGSGQRTANRPPGKNAQRPGNDQGETVVIDSEQVRLGTGVPKKRSRPKPAPRRRPISKDQTDDILLTRSLNKELGLDKPEKPDK